MLHGMSLSTHTSTVELLQHHALALGCDGYVEGLLKEYEELQTERELRSRNCTCVYQSPWALGEQSLFLVYALARCLRPKTALETGVADGHSSFVILSALSRNGCGQLHSVDISPEVGFFLNAEERKGWHLHLLRDAHRRADFQQLLGSLPPIDFFLHDSDHRYRWQHFELTSVFQKSSRDCLIATDDADSSLAFLDFCQEVGAAPVFLVEKRKVFGLLLPPGWSGLFSD
jgi:predicted O-methyltransferase YrrM